jgi:DNA-binding transcriptional regulator GbsR (MarR family)
MNNIKHNNVVDDARSRLIEAGGRTAQELGLGRIVGQMLVYLYLTNGECSLDKISQGLELSKASVSIAARQLESMGLLHRSWKKGDRKNYFRTAENFETALRQGLMTFLFQKIRAVGLELNYVNELLEDEAGKNDSDPDTHFVYGRVKRAKSLNDKITGLLDHPFLKFTL